MKSIKFFKYYNTCAFERFLNTHGYKTKDVKDFRVVEKKQRFGNILKVYSISFRDGNEKYFKVVFFKNFDECNQSILGFKDDKLLRWWKDANVKKYKIKNLNVYGMEC